MLYPVTGKGAATFGAGGGGSAQRVAKSSSCPCLVSKGATVSDARSGTPMTGSPPKASSAVGDLLKRACACFDQPRAVKLANKWEEIERVANDLLPSEAAYALYRLGHMQTSMDSQKRSEMAASKVVDTLLARVAPGATDLSAPALVHTLDGCARLGLCNFKLLRNLSLRVRELVPQLSARQTAVVLDAFATLNHVLPDGMYTDLSQAIVRLAGDMTATDASKTWSAFRAFKQKPSEDAAAALTAHVLNHTQSYTRSQLADCLDAWAALGMRISDSLMEKLRKVATCAPQRPSSLMDAGSVGPNPAYMLALMLNGLNPTPPPRLVIPGYNSNIVPAPRFRFPPRAKPPLAKSATQNHHMDRTPSDDSSAAAGAVTVSRSDAVGAQQPDRSQSGGGSSGHGGATAATPTGNFARAGSGDLLRVAAARPLIVPDLKLRTGAGDGKAARSKSLVLADGQHPARISPRQVL